MILFNYLFNILIARQLNFFIKFCKTKLFIGDFFHFFLSCFIFLLGFSFSLLPILCIFAFAQNKIPKNINNTAAVVATPHRQYKHARSHCGQFYFSFVISAMKILLTEWAKQILPIQINNNNKQPPPLKYRKIKC